MFTCTNRLVICILYLLLAIGTHALVVQLVCGTFVLAFFKCVHDSRVSMLSDFGLKILV